MQKSKLEFKIKNFIQDINNLFIKITLFFFYLLIIGFGALIYRIFKKKNKKVNSYWQVFSQEKLDLEYFKSAY